MHWHNNFRMRSRMWFAILAVVVTATGLLVKRSLASDHQDTADVELNPSMDMTDVYAFPGASADRIALVLNSWALLTPADAKRLALVGGRVVGYAAGAALQTYEKNGSKPTLLRSTLYVRLVKEPPVGEPFRK